jgi:truncated hemoglobin YjbI
MPVLAPRPTLSGNLLFNAHANGDCHVPEPAPTAQTDGGPAGLPAAQDAIAPPDSDREPTLFAWAGGHDALTRMTRMTRIFYGRYVPADPLLAPLFAGKSPDHPERVAAWRGETFGGPKTYREQYGGYPHMVAYHLGKGITEAQRSRWAQLICQAAISRAASSAVKRRMIPSRTRCFLHGYGRFRHRLVR